MNSGIYVITNLANNKCYVGSSCNLRSRKSAHFTKLARGLHKNLHLQAAYTKYKHDAFDYRVLEYCEPDKLIERESYWIEHLDTRDRTKGYNQTNADRSEPTDEVRAKISAARRRQADPRKGTKHSEEARAKISEGRKGIPAWNKGKQWSDEHKAKLSQIHTGKKLSDEHKANIQATSSQIQSDPAYKVRHSERMKEWWANRKAQS